MDFSFHSFIASNLNLCEDEISQMEYFLHYFILDENRGSGRAFSKNKSCEKRVLDSWIKGRRWSLNLRIIPLFIKSWFSKYIREMLLKTQNGQIDREQERGSASHFKTIVSFLWILLMKIKAINILFKEEIDIKYGSRISQLKFKN